MAYFSNSSEGAFFDEQCGNCIHADESALCPVCNIQMTWNYDQLKDGQENLKKAMDILVSSTEGCRMKPLIDNLRYGKKAIPAVLKKKLIFGDEAQIRALKEL